MEWTRAFYQKQYELLARGEVWPKVWESMTQNGPPPHVRLLERLAGAGPKRVLELGCGSGIIAGAMAVAGHSVVAVDLAPIAVAHARQIAESLPNGRMEVMGGDFFEIDPPGVFDAICYFDGFGTGSDDDQRRLLRRIAAWLSAGGCALIDIYNPYHLPRIDGVVYEETDQVTGRTNFDPETCRLLNTIWHNGEEHGAITQTLRCYSPVDLRVLLERTGLRLDQVESYESGHHARRVPLREAPIYLVKLVPESLPTQ